MNEYEKIKYRFSVCKIQAIILYIVALIKIYSINIEAFDEALRGCIGIIVYIVCDYLQKKYHE